MPVTFNAEIEEPPPSPPETPQPAVVDLTTPEKTTPPPPTPKSEPPPIARQCGFSRCTVQEPSVDSMWLEIGVYVGCLTAVAMTAYTLGYRHALENTLSNMLADVAA